MHFTLYESLVWLPLLPGRLGCEGGAVCAHLRWQDELAAGRPVVAKGDLSRFLRAGERGHAGWPARDVGVVRFARSADRWQDAAIAPARIEPAGGWRAAHQT